MARRGRGRGAAAATAAAAAALLLLPGAGGAYGDGGGRFGGGGGEQQQQQPPCGGSYESPVVSLCPANWPDASADRVWMVVFHAPWCGHCRTLEPKLAELARQLAGDGAIGIGALDCSVEENQALCRKHKVVGYPTLKAIVAGLPKSYDGARETGPMQAWILKVARQRGSNGGSARCPAGLFGDRAADAVVPLCREHFPGRDSNHDWLAVFYDSTASGAQEVRAAANQASADLGNLAPDADRAQGKKKRRRQRERLMRLANKYKLSLTLPSAGPAGSAPIAKVGGVCCDCAADAGRRFCRSVLGAAAARQLASSAGGAAVVWAAAGGEARLLREAFTVTPRDLVEATLERLGYLSGGDARGGGDEL